MSVITYGPYSCAPDAAVKDSYLLNLAQTAADTDEMLTGEILTDYATGRLTFEEAAKELEDFVKQLA